MSTSQGIDADSLDWLTLDEAESIIWSAKPHESSLIPALVMGIPLSIVLIGLFIIAGAYFHRENTRYVVTTDALYKKTGILSRDVQRIDFGKVQNTSYSQGFFGAQFGYGTVEISTAGGSGVEMRFRSVPDPREVQERINKRIKTQRGEDGPQSAESSEDVLDDILAELRAIRETLEGEPTDEAVAEEDERKAEGHLGETGTVGGRNETE